MVRLVAKGSQSREEGLSCKCRPRAPLRFTAMNEEPGRVIVMGAGPLADQTLGEARVRERFGVTVVAITKARGPVLHNPTADTVLRTGDRVRVFGLPDQLAAFRREAGG